MALALAVAGALVAGGARAQVSSLGKPVSLGIRVGVFMPKNTDNGKTLYALGVDGKINLPFIPVIGGQEVSFDYLTKNSNARLAGLTVVQKFSSPTVVSGQPKTYVGIGVGAYNFHLKTDTIDETKTVAGVKGLLGVNFNNYYVQGDYHYPMGTTAKQLRGFAVTVGMRY
jgi:hypothetical protein